MLLLLLFINVPVKASGDFDGFPESYKQGLRELKQKHPNWTFVPVNTGMDWKYAVYNEIYTNGKKGGGLNYKSVIWKTAPDSYKYIDSNGKNVYLDNTGNWFLASEEAVEYYMNPKNYLDEKHIFAFEQLSYNSKIHSLSGIEGVIRSSWMNNNNMEDNSWGGARYANVILQAGMDSGVSPYHLASRIIQEQGSNGSGFLISGDYSQYHKYGIDVNYSLFNYYNIGASGSTKEAVVASGLRYALKNNWTTRAVAIDDGAKFIGRDYINRGQDTLYLEKFDVDRRDGSVFNHQYMQNIQAPMSESVGVFNAYANTGSLNQNFIFSIPVYQNMPYEKPPVDKEKVEEFVTRLYNVCLDREPDAAGLKDWTNILTEQRMTGAQVAYGFAFSDEFKHRNFCNECYVKHLYRAFLGREYDAEGFKHWIELLETGYTREEIFYRFALSDEFALICMDCGIEPGQKGTIPQYGTVPTGKCSGCGKKDGVTTFVTRLYKTCLDRKPDADGLKYHCNSLWNHQCTGIQVAKNFVFSNEFISRGYSDEEYIKHLYKVFLDREVEPDGMKHWITCLQNGESREAVFGRIGNSDEFKKLCLKNGIAY